MGMDQRSLAESERYFRALTEQSSDIVTLLDIETRVLYASPSMERVLGYAPHELLGQRALELLHPDDLEQVMGTVMEGVAIPGAIRRLEYRFKHKDGSWRYLEGVGRNLLDDPAIAAIVVNARDVTDRKGTQAALRERERQLAAAQALAHVGSWEWDMVTNVVTWSDELYNIYGLPLGSPAGYEQFLACVHPDDQTRVKQLIDGQFVDHQPLEYEWQVQQPGGDVRYLHSRQIVIRDAQGQPVRMVGTSHDITERRRAEEEIRVLKGILPTCATCKRIRNEDGHWEQMEMYVRRHSEAEFSHGLCPDCAVKTWGAPG